MSKQQESLERARKALRNVYNGDSGSALINDNSLRRFDCNGATTELEIELGYPAKTQVESFLQCIQDELEKISGLGKINAALITSIAAHQVQKGVKRLPGVKNVIAIAASKGGVGKSVTAVNLALALADEGARVGLLDADIYGPSIPEMLGIEGQQPTLGDTRLLEPISFYGIETMSIGFLMETETPMIWRAPMVAQTLNQMLYGTRWHDLDYLLIDFPPSAGDIQLSLVQQAPLCGALIVTTAEEIILNGAKRDIRMFEKAGIPLLGVVENMSIHVCPNCGHAEPIFGSGGGEKLSEGFGIDCLGWLPFDVKIRELIDESVPIMIGAPDSRTADIYRSVARQMTARLAQRPKDAGDGFPGDLPIQEEITLN